MIPIVFIFIFIILFSFIIHYVSKDDFSEENINITHSDDTIALVKEVFCCCYC
jgi:hypothetical protein